MKASITTRFVVLYLEAASYIVDVTKLRNRRVHERTNLNRNRSINGIDFAYYIFRLFILFGYRGFILTNV